MSNENNEQPLRCVIRKKFVPGNYLRVKGDKGNQAEFTLKLEHATRFSLRDAEECLRRMDLDENDRLQLEIVSLKCVEVADEVVSLQRAREAVEYAKQELDSARIRYDAAVERLERYSK